MSKALVILTDGMADEPLAELGGKTPLEYAHTPYMDAIAEKGASGTFLSLPAGFPTSSDVANMSVLGYDLAQGYCGRGPLEAVGCGIEMGDQDVAFRCNLVYADGDVLADYSAGHIPAADADVLIKALKAEFDCPDFTFHSGVSYRNLLILHGADFSPELIYHKADAAHGMRIPDILLQPGDASREAAHTAEVVNQLMLRARPLLAAHPVNRGKKNPANMIWAFSPGYRPKLEPFAEKYGMRGAIISAVDVIFGLGAAAKMDLVRVEGATGFIDTNYEGKAAAALAALADHDFVYVHVEAADECSHIGDLKLKLQAIEDIDRRLIGPLWNELAQDGATFAVLPDHPVPVKKQVHTREPVPFAICGAHIQADTLTCYSETAALTGGAGYLTEDAFMRLVTGIE